jgi:hypothetical protein
VNGRPRFVPREPQAMPVACGFARYRFIDRADFFRDAQAAM